MPYGTLEVAWPPQHRFSLQNGSVCHFNSEDPREEKHCCQRLGKDLNQHAWNESFVFTITNDVSKLHLKIMDKDTFTDDDCFGEATISLEAVFIEGIVPPTAYNVVNKDQEYQGEIKIGFNFTPQPEMCFIDDCTVDEENYGGWKESTF